MNQRNRILNIFLVTVFLLTACGFTMLPSKDLRSTPESIVAPAQVVNQPVVQATSTYRAFLPLTSRDVSNILWGITMDSYKPGGELDMMAAAGANLVRRDLNWSAVETSPGARNWNGAGSFDRDLANARAKNIQVMGIIEGTPKWALKEGYTCGAVALDQMQRLGNFMYDTVKRYSVYPHNIKYWELWNEPDAGNDYMGCWGEPGDPYFGGRYYAEMLKVVYPRIKQADPDAQVLVGGLLLDCDPRVTIRNVHDASDIRDCTPSKFLEGILKNGGGSYFNGVSFHAYDYNNPGQFYYHSPNWNSSQTTTGPVALVKADFLRSVLESHGVYNKYLINTETALFCPKGCNDADELRKFEREKSNYILQSYASSLAYNFKSSVWWSAMGHQYSGLLNSGNFTALPAYKVFQFTKQKLGDAQYVRRLNQPGIMGFEFRRNNRPVWVLWSLDGSMKSVGIANPTAIFSIGEDGSPVPLPLTGTLQVGLLAVLVEY